MCGAVQAEIVDSVFWESAAHNWTGTGMQVQNGKVSGTNDALDQFIKSPLTQPSHPDGQLEGFENVDRVKLVFSEADWDETMADANEHYTYEAFLRAVAKFPAFCNESNSPLNYDLDSTCKREIAALFAHMMSESE